MTTVTYDEIVLGLRARGAPLAKCEKAARDHLAKFGQSPPKTKRRRKGKPSAPDGTTLAFLTLLAREKIPAPVRELKFDAHRQWRLDYGWPEHRVALEIEGGVWTGGRHTRGEGFLGDVAKYNRLAELGWRLIRATPSQLGDVDMITSLRALLILAPIQR